MELARRGQNFEAGCTIELMFDDGERYVAIVVAIAMTEEDAAVSRCS